jgi:hypothetical protein
MTKKTPTKKKTKTAAKKAKVVVARKVKKTAKKAKPQKKSSRTTPASAHATATPGAIVVGTDPCVCGDSPEEHGRYPTYPGSTACRVCMTCIAYEADTGADPLDPSTGDLTS